jgi:hypothetical protein
MFISAGAGAGSQTNISMNYIQKIKKIKIKNENYTA